MKILAFRIVFFVALAYFVWTSNDVGSCSAAHAGLFGCE